MVLELLGVTNKRFPDNESIAVLIQNIKETIPKYGVNEIVVAFKLLVHQKLNINIEHYQSLDSMYFNRVMKAYKEQKRGIALLEKNKLLQKAQLPQETPKSDKQLQDQNWKWLTDHYKKTGKFPQGVNYVHCYDYGIRENLFNPTTDEKVKIKEETIKDLNKRLEIAQIKRQHIASTMIETTLKEPKALKVECKVYFVKGFVRGLNLKL